MPRALSALEQIEHFVDQDLLLEVLGGRGIMRACVACVHRGDCGSETDQLGLCEFYDLDLRDPIKTEQSIEAALVAPRCPEPVLAVAA